MFVFLMKITTTLTAMSYLLSSLHSIHCSLEKSFDKYVNKTTIFGRIVNKLTNESIVVDSCGLTNINDVPVIDKIIGGYEAVKGQFPYQVLLRIRRKDGRVMVCGGSILNERWILTAGHCVSNERTGDLYVNGIEVSVGITHKEERDANVQKQSVECVLPHEKWVGLRGGFANDLALLRVSALNITHNSGGYVNGVCLPLRAKKPFEFIGKARISGWGITQKGKSSSVLKYTDVGLIDDKQCHKNRFPFPIVDSMLCQGIDRTSPCFGDSGGPLVVRIKGRYTQLGVVSSGPAQCANSEDPNGIYTQLSYFLDWIENTISRNSEQMCFGFRLKKFE